MRRSRTASRSCTNNSQETLGPGVPLFHVENGILWFTRMNRLRQEWRSGGLEEDFDDWLGKQPDSKQNEACQAIESTISALSEVFV